MDPDVTTIHAFYSSTAGGEQVTPKPSGLKWELCCDPLFLGVCWVQQGGSSAPLLGLPQAADMEWW